MCDRCDYEGLLERAGLSVTPNRLQVLGIIGDSEQPLTAREIYGMIDRPHAMNRVTLYRILDILVDHNLVARISAGDRSFRFGLAESVNHPSHPHFYCTSCGNMVCLDPHSLHNLQSDIRSFQKTFPAVVQNVEVRLDGICGSCLKSAGKEAES